MLLALLKINLLCFGPPGQTEKLLRCWKIHSEYRALKQKTNTQRAEWIPPSEPASPSSLHFSYPWKTLCCDSCHCSCYKNTKMWPNAASATKGRGWAESPAYSVGRGPHERLLSAQPSAWEVEKAGNAYMGDTACLQLLAPRQLWCHPWISWDFPIARI